MKHVIIALLVFFSIGKSVAQTPAPPQEKPVLIMNAIAHIGNGEVIENAVVGFEKGLLTLVADARTIRLDTTGYRVIDGSGHHVYPGFIAPNTQLGLTEIDLVRATRDYAEVGEFTPHVRALIAYNTDSRIIPTIRTNGVLLSQIVPKKGRIAGTSSIVQLDAWNWEDAVVAADQGVHLYWSALYARRGWWAEQKGVEKNEAWSKALQEVRQFMDEAKGYAAISDPETIHQPFEAMRGLFEGTQQLYIHVNGVQDIRQALTLVEEYDLEAVLVGARDAWMITDEVKAAGVAVILRSPHSLPGYEDADVEQPYKTAQILHDAGIPYCLSIDGSWQVRNLPFVAGTTVHYGLTREQALMSISSAPAEILGIDDRYGTLEEGKSATLFLSTGDALDMRTHNVVAAFIDGRQIDLNNHQKELYETYKEKYGLE